MSVHALESAVSEYCGEMHHQECTRAKLALLRENGTAVEVIDLELSCADSPSPSFASSFPPEVGR
jgi:hypothetical protein